MVKRKKGMTVAKARGGLYTLARGLGDGNAVAKGRVGERVARRVKNRILWKLLGRLFR
jgi:hypothetical protein